MMLRFRIMALTGALAWILLAPLPVQAKTVEYELTIAKEEVNLTGKPARGMTINGEIPGPVLRFKEGDMARILVHNKMSVDTSIHWHGILVPPEMDGVPYVNFPPIKPGTTFTYEFPIRQSGTYWYHSHTSLQEQSGVYGPIVIQKRRKNPEANPEHVILLSDWTDENPYKVNRTLKRGSEWYAIEKGSAQSLFGAIRLGMFGQYLKRELQRMPAMDIADVAYDRFLVNGKSESTLDAKPGETVRLRIIDGSATTYFHLEFAGGPMTLVAADGQDTEPIQEKRFLISVAETYDVLVKIPATGAYEFRATAQDGSGYASVWMGSGQRHPAPNVPSPNLYQTMGSLRLGRIFALTPAASLGMSDRAVKAGRFDQPGMMGMGQMKMGGMESTAGMDAMEMETMETGVGMDTDATNAPPSGMAMPPPPSAPPPSSRIGKKFGANFWPLASDVSSSKPLAMDGTDPRRPWPPYDKLRATHSTTLPKDNPVREIRLTLDGDMERYVWFLNNKPLSESDSIRIKKGETVRFIMINRTMMHHPMHLHGHFFRVLNGQGDRSPLKHTVNVAPMSTTVIEFDANEFGDWFFHCHLLYHMKSGMTRVVHYEDFTLNPALAAIRPALYKDTWYFWGQVDALSHMTEGFLQLSNIRNIFTAAWEVGWQDVDETEWEPLFTWDRYINRFFSLFIGADLLGAKDTLEETRAVFGIRYLLPFNLESRVWVDSDGGARINLEKIIALTPRLSMGGETQYDTHERWEGRAGLSYILHRDVSLIGQWHSVYGFGGGLQLRF